MPRQESFISSLEPQAGGPDASPSAAPSLSPVIRHSFRQNARRPSRRFLMDAAPNLFGGRGTSEAGCWRRWRAPSRRTTSLFNFSQHWTWGFQTESFSATNCINVSLALSRIQVSDSLQGSSYLLGQSFSACFVLKFALHFDPRNTFRPEHVIKTDKGIKCTAVFLQCGLLQFVSPGWL